MHDLSITRSVFVILSLKTLNALLRWPLLALSSALFLLKLRGCAQIRGFLHALFFFSHTRFNSVPSHLGCSFSLAKRLTWEQISFVRSPIFFLVTTLSNNLQPMGGHVERRPIKFSPTCIAVATLHRAPPPLIVDFYIKWKCRAFRFNNTLKVKACSGSAYVLVEIRKL